MADLAGKDFVAVVRLSDAENRTIAEIGQSCERVPAGKNGGTVSDALSWLLECGAIAPKAARPVERAVKSKVETRDVSGLPVAGEDI